MDDKKGHRGQHPADRKLFAPTEIDVLRTAVFELSWLLERGYSSRSALALVGNRHALRRRQRQAVERCSCGDSHRNARIARHLGPSDLVGRHIAVDGFNCLITLETAMAGGVVLVGRDTAHRDMSSVHGSYRRVEETHRAVSQVASLFAACRVASVRWLLDRPVSNSGRLKAIIEDAAPAGLSWRVDLVYNPDRELCAETDAVVASSDAWVLDHCGPWLDIPAAVIDRGTAGNPWLVDLGCDRHTPTVLRQ